MPSPGAVVIGGYINGLGLVRALAARGVPTAVVTTKPYDIAHRSRWVTDHAAVSNLEEHPDSLAELLERRASAWKGWTLFPTNDESLAALAQHESRLHSTYTLAVPPSGATRFLLDKGLMNEVAAAVGASVPRCYGPASAATAANPQLCFPVLVKPVVSYRFFARFGCKLFVAHDRAQLGDCIRRMAEARIDGHVIEFVPGPDSAVHAHCLYVNGRREVLPGLTVRKIRQSPPRFGVARVAEVIDENVEMREVAIEMVRRIGLVGMVVAEFKRDERDGRLRFIELNGRSVIYNALLRKAGLDMAGLAWNDYARGTYERPRPHRWRGTWVNLHADVLYSALHSGHRVALPEFLHPYRRRTMDAVWSSADPAPFLWQWSRSASMAAKGLLHGSYRDLMPDPARPATQRPAVRAQRDSTARNFLPS